MRDGLVGADRAAELLALLGVVDGHVQRARGDADGLRGRRGGDRVPGAGERSRSPVSSARRRAVEPHGEQRAGAVERVAPARPTRPRPRTCRPPAAVTTITSAPAASGTAILTPVRRSPARSVDAPGRRRRPRPTSRPCRAALELAAAQQQPGRPGRQQRRGRERVAELLGHDAQLDDAEALAALVLRDGDARPAEPGDLVPVRVAAPPRRSRSLSSG